MTLSKLRSIISYKTRLPSWAPYCLLLALACTALVAHAESPELPITNRPIGFIGSLTGFAAKYGQAVSDGANLAIDEAPGEARLVIEDDQSNINSVNSAYRKLVSIDHIKGLIGGSWWARPLAPLVQRDGIPFVSVETIRDRDFTFYRNYFVAGGDLRSWVRVFTPVWKERQLKRAAIIRFNSGFAKTIAEEIDSIVKTIGGEIVLDIEYDELDIAAASTYVAQVKRANPDFLYIDAQPESALTILRRLSEQKLSKLPVFGNSVFEVVCRSDGSPCASFSEIYYNYRSSLSAAFSAAFFKKYGRQPELNSDIAYFSTKMLLAALQQPDPVSTLEKMQFRIDGGEVLYFDNEHVLQGLKQKVRTLKNGVPQ